MRNLENKELSRIVESITDALVGKKKKNLPFLIDQTGKPGSLRNYKEQSERSKLSSGNVYTFIFLKITCSVHLMLTISMLLELTI